MNLYKNINMMYFLFERRYAITKRVGIRYFSIRVLETIFNKFVFVISELNADICRGKNRKVTVFLWGPRVWRSSPSIIICTYRIEQIR